MGIPSEVYTKRITLVRGVTAGRGYTVYHGTAKMFHLTFDVMIETIA